MAAGAVLSQDGIGYTLFYATNFIFTGLGVAVWPRTRVVHRRRGQPTSAGCAAARRARAGRVASADRAAAAVLAGRRAARRAFGPAWLQTRRGSHIVITTIMFNFIASAR